MSLKRIIKWNCSCNERQKLWKDSTTTEKYN